MNRRDFLRLIGVAPIAPSVLFLEQNTQEKCSLAMIKKAVRERIDKKHNIDGGIYIERQIAFATEDTQWFRCSPNPYGVKMVKLNVRDIYK